MNAPTLSLPQQPLTTTDDARAAWLAERRTGLGGSDAGVILGVNPYKTSLQLYLEKRGELDEPNLEDKESVRVGRDLEDYVAQRYSQRMEVKVERCTRILRHPVHAWMLGNVDRLVWEDGKRPQHKGEIRTHTLLECKTALGRFTDKTLWGADGTDEVPLTYLAQCQHYMAVSGATRCDLAVLLAGPEFRVYHIHRDNELINALIERGAEFWHRVETGNAPDFDPAHPTAGALLDRLYPGTDGSTVVLPDTVAHWHAVLQESKTLAGEYDKQAEIAKNHIRRLMGNAAMGLLPDGTAYTRKQVKRAAYEVSANEYIEFRFTKKAKEAA